MTPAKALRVLVADDERLARQRLEDLLAHEENIEIVGRTDNGPSTVAAIRELEPDLVFLDIQMPGKTGLEVVREIGAAAMPPVIFTTAYDHAVAAFDLAAIDYLIKPFDDERFEKAFRRARKMIELNQVSKLSEELRALLSEGSWKREAGSGKREYLERIAVEMRGQVRIVPVKQIDYLIASGPYAELYVGDKRYLIRERMQALEERLDPTRFFRIHRSAIVRLDLIETLIRNPGGDYAVQLKGGVKLKVSRSRFEKLEQQMAL
ncbi:MAG: two-component system, LytTR family, response regulator [Gemmatimonadaceae bacterium]|jgi:two-component system LytT family response regulator|nr:two-component system, LytTR family, response regulator [Gemmatimonadaceae bacterium]